MSNKEIKKYDYHIALSFAGENREYVEEVAHLLKSYGVSVFYDKFEEATLWGKNLLDYLQDIYKNKAQYTIMFISQYYAQKVWTTHERQSMQERAYKESKEYILPARFDETEVPGMYSTISYIDLNHKTPYEFVQLVLQKINWQTKQRWFGKWEIESSALCYGGTLNINNINSNEFYFNLTVVHGSHVGDIEGIAKISTKNEAEYISNEAFGEEGKCVIKFKKFNDTIQVTENLGCSIFHGMRVMFNGDFKLNKDIFYDRVELKDSVLSNIFNELNEKLFTDFLKCFCDIHNERNLDSFQSNVISGGVAGLYSIYEAILMYCENNNVYGAFLHDNGEIHYFSSDDIYKINIPKTIKKWIDKFENKQNIVYTKEKEKEKRDRILK